MANSFMTTALVNSYPKRSADEQIQTSMIDINFELKHWCR